VAAARASRGASTGPGWNVIDRVSRMYWCVGWDAVRRPYINAEGGSGQVSVGKIAVRV
jgi:hypothetical protein